MHCRKTVDICFMIMVRVQGSDVVDLVWMQKCDLYGFLDCKNVYE